MNKKAYTKPSVLLIPIDEADILRTSPNDTDKEFSPTNPGEWDTTEI